MRRVVFQMMTTLDGRSDDPGAWVTGVGDDLYTEIDRVYGTFDTVLVGQTTNEEMFAYWPGAETEDSGFAESSPEINKSLARKMNSYRKFVFSSSDQKRVLE